MGNEPVTAAGSRPPLAWAKSATVAQVVAVVAGILAMASGIVMRRIIGSATVSPILASSVTWRTELLSVWPAGAAVLVAIVALMLRGRARWLHYPQIGLWLLVLADSIAIAYLGAVTIGLRPLFGWLVAGVFPGVITIVLLGLSLRRPAR